MKTTVSRRGVKGAKRLDVNQWKEMLGQQETTTSLGIVRQFPGETSHFEVSTENGTNEILVDVELIPSQVRVLCRLGFGNQGVYSIPKVDTEVAVLLPYDSKSLIKDPMDFGPIIVGILDNNAPSQLSDDTIIILGDDTAGPLATKADLDALAAYVDKQFSTVGHVHATGVGPTTSTTAGSTPSGGTAGVPAAVGTTKTKAT